MLLDIIFLGLILVMAIRGRSRGFVKSLLGFATIFLAIVITMTLNGPFTEIMAKTPVYDALRAKTVLNVNPSGSTGPDNAFRDILDDAAAAMSGTVNEFTDNVAKSVLSLVISVILFIVSLIVISMATRFLDSIFKLPGLNFLNSVGGAVWGVLNAVVISYILLAFVSILRVINGSTLFAKLLENSIIVIRMYENNPVFKFFI